MKAQVLSDTVFGIRFKPHGLDQFILHMRIIHHHTFPGLSEHFTIIDVARDFFFN